MAHTDHHAPFAGTAGDFAALFEVLGDRLFEQDVVSRVDGLDRRVEMDVLGVEISTMSASTPSAKKSS